MPAEAALPSSAAADQALAFLVEMSPDIRGAAILGPGGELLAARGGEGWHEAAAALLSAADRAGGRPFGQIHIGTGQGEVFAVRRRGLVAIAVTERFTLASLMAFDLRASLRDLASGQGEAAPVDPV